MFWIIYLSIFEIFARNLKHSTMYISQTFLSEILQKLFEPVLNGDFLLLPIPLSRKQIRLPKTTVLMSQCCRCQSRSKCCEDCSSMVIVETVSPKYIFYDRVMWRVQTSRCESYQSSVNRTCYTSSIQFLYYSLQSIVKGIPNSLFYR